MSILSEVRNINQFTAWKLLAERQGELNPDGTFKVIRSTDNQLDIAFKGGLHARICQQVYEIGAPTLVKKEILKQIVTGLIEQNPPRVSKTSTDLPKGSKV